MTLAIIYILIAKHHRKSPISNLFGIFQRYLDCPIFHLVICLLSFGICYFLIKEDFSFHAGKHFFRPFKNTAATYTFYKVLALQIIVKKMNLVTVMELHNFDVWCRLCMYVGERGRGGVLINNRYIFQIHRH